MGLYAVKPRFQRALAPVEEWLVTRRVHPDALTGAAVGLALAGGAALWLANREAAWLLVVPPVALGRTALNALDGLVARRLGLARPWGELLNEVGDRVADTALLAGAALAPGADPRLGAVALVLALLVSYTGTAARAAGGRRQYGGICGKADRLLWLAAAAVLAWCWPTAPVFSGLSLLLIAALPVTLAQRLAAAYRELPGASDRVSESERRSLRTVP